jgi:hypothetical protein
MLACRQQVYSGNIFESVIRHCCSFSIRRVILCLFLNLKIDTTRCLLWAVTKRTAIYLVWMNWISVSCLLYDVDVIELNAGFSKDCRNIWQFGSWLHLLIGTVSPTCLRDGCVIWDHPNARVQEDLTAQLYRKGEVSLHGMSHFKLFHNGPNEGAHGSIRML